MNPAPVSIGSSVIPLITLWKCTVLLTQLLKRRSIGNVTSPAHSLGVMSKVYSWKVDPSSADCTYLNTQARAAYRPGVRPFTHVAKTCGTIPSKSLGAPYSPLTPNSKWNGVVVPDWTTHSCGGPTPCGSVVRQLLVTIIPQPSAPFLRADSET